MRHSELHQSARGKPDSTQLKMINYSPDLSSFMAEDDFVELLWENGQVVMQGQSNRNKKGAMADRVPREQHVDRVNEKDTRDFSFPKTSRLDVMDSFINNFSLPGPSNNGQLNSQDDDMVPWMNYPMEDAITNEYCSEFLSDIPGDSLNSLSVHNSSASIPKSSGFFQTFRGPFSVENGNTSKMIADSSDPSRTKTTQFYELLHNNQTSAPSIKSRDEDFCVGSSNGSQQGPSGNMDFIRLQKQDLAATKPLNQNSIGLMNFSHFSRPVALAKANLHSVERLKSNENPSTATSSKTVESTVIQSAAGFPTRLEGPSSPITKKLDNRSTAKTFREIFPIEQSNEEYQKDASRINVNMNNGSSNCISTDHANHRSANSAKGLSFWCSETERGHEAVVASSSVCSGNSAGGASNEPKQRDKRKDQEGEESGNHSAGQEDESVGQKKSISKGTSAKRSRAAEVHNLSERRRRDRINEKMHALQELIPNCNKVDKASMLDEAIEYLKTLQLQVQFFTQMMSMGTGLCMPPMMPPGGIQHMRMPPIAHFSQMGLGMGMGMRFGYGMGMLDMNGPPNCMVPVPPMHSPQFRCATPSVPGPQGLPLMPGSATLPMLGMSRQGLPVPMTSMPLVASAPGLPATVGSVPEVSAAPTNTACPPDAESLKDGTMGKCRDNDLQGIKESFKDSTFVQMSSKGTHTSESQDAN